MFDQRKQQPNNHNHILDHVTTLNNSYNSYEPLKFGSQVSKELGNWTKKDGGVQFKVQKNEDHHDDGDFSPPLWQTNPPRSPVHRNYRSLSPNSRSQEIARGQWELMEMVKNMPESCYELSLKDIVEKPIIALKSQQEGLIKRGNDQKKAKMIRSESIENGGLLLKMVSPVSLISKKKKKNLTNTTKVSPKPEEFENPSKNIEKDWWKKRVSGSSSVSSSSRNGSSGSSTSTRNDSSRKRNGFLNSCWPRLCFSKSLSAG